MNLTDLNQGLTIAVLGLVFAFLSMGVLLAVIQLLKKFFPYKAEAEEEDGSNTIIAAVDERANEETVLAAAIGVAVLTSRSNRPSQVGNSFARGHLPARRV